MRTIVRRGLTAVLLAGTTGAVLGLTAPAAHAYCPVPGVPVVPCASAVHNCVTVRVYNPLDPSPSVQVCPFH